MASWTRRHLSSVLWWSQLTADEGIGTALVAAAMAQAALDGFDQLSLSVEPDNPAARLYERLGFQRVATYLGSWTMVTTTIR